MSRTAKTDRTDRAAIAQAACDVSGIPFVDLTDVPAKDRAYFFAVPDGAGCPFGIDRLKEKLSDLDVLVDSDRDRRSDHFGLRFVHKSTPIPNELKPYQSAEARETWATWRNAEFATATMTRDLAVAVAETDPDMDADASLRVAAKSASLTRKKAISR